MAEGRFTKIVPRGTLTTSHLEAIASLPPEEQKRAEDRMKAGTLAQNWARGRCTQYLKRGGAFLRV